MGCAVEMVSICECLTCSVTLCATGLGFASEAIQQDQVFWEYTIHSAEGAVWVGVGRVRPDVALDLLPDIDPTKDSVW